MGCFAQPFAEGAWCCGRCRLPTPLNPLPPLFFPFFAPFAPSQDLPAENFGYFVAVAFVGSFVGISYAHLVVQFTTPNPALAVLAFQFLILVIFPFSGGIFIRDDQVGGAPSPRVRFSNLLGKTNRHT